MCAEFPYHFFIKESSMKALIQKVKSFFADEQGATAVEYGLFVAAIAAVIITAVVAIGNKVSTAFNTVNSTLPGA